jgi:hypothetical protein
MPHKNTPPGPILHKEPKQDPFIGWYSWTCSNCGRDGQGIHMYKPDAIRDWRYHYYVNRCTK